MLFAQKASRTLALVITCSLAAGCSGGGSGGGGGSTPATSSPTTSPTATPTPVSTTGPVGTDAYTCASSDAASSARVGRLATGDAVHRDVRRRFAQSPANTGLIAVTYERGLGTAAKTNAVQREGAARATFVREMTFAHTGRYERLLHVAPGTEEAAVAALRSQPGVVAASMTGTKRFLEVVSQKYYTNDPYYDGFTQTQITNAGDTGSATYEDGLSESASVPGQWGMHAVRLESAQAYSQSNNGSGVVNAGALGASRVKIAVIDSGQDDTHPELASKIAYQKCFITGSGGQSVSNFSTDEDGHGTDVSGIAAAASGNGLGFTGSGGLASIYAYRVFPTPDDSCVPGYTGTVDAQCGASTIDIESAIEDAVSQGVNVISLSLGGGGCTNGADSDSTFNNAIDDALSANVVVVAAAGNGGTSGVSSPGCIDGVIAVGASAIDDGVATGTSTAPVGTSSSPVEYVASYSQYGSPAAAAGNAGAWGIVAPGGDPSDADDSPTATTTDDLHWIENIWTTTPYDTNYSGSCTPDFASTTSIEDCRTLIAGTSQATPVVSGAVALIIAANSSYQSPSKMKTLLCTTAHDIGDAHEGCGRLDLYRAMATAVGDPSLPASQ